MPSPFGHALAGVAVAWGGDEPRAIRWGLTWTCAAVAAAPDLDLLLPHGHRAYTHSLGALALVTIVTGAVTAWVTPARARRVTLLIAAAYGSHLLLDWLQVDNSFPYGIRALWPLSDGWYISGLNLFPPTARGRLLAFDVIAPNVHAIAWEALTLGPIVAGIRVARLFLVGPHPS